jgi:hypothetical protein
VSIASLGNNLIGDPTGCTVFLLPTDLVGDPQLAPFVDDGTAGGGYLPLQPTSPALDAGDDAICTSPPVNGVDQRGVSRPQGPHCDIGAYEVSVSAAPNLLFVSSRSSGRAGAVTFRDEDIVAYDFASNTWQMVFDGSDVGITKDVDAFAFRGGDLLLSFNGPTVVPGLGAVDDADIVRFTPTQLGNDTAGSFAWQLRGADVGLTTDGEDIDLIDFSTDGRLIVSTIGDFDAPDASGHDEDLFMLNTATFGNPSSGVWGLFLVGADEGLANEDINGLWIDPTTGEFYLTVKDSFAFVHEEAEVQIDSDDIFICTLQPGGGCAYRLFWDSAVHDYGAENLDAIDLGALPASFVASAQASSTATLTPAEIAEDNDPDDLAGEELIHDLFLPLLER